MEIQTIKKEKVKKILAGTNIWSDLEKGCNNKIKKMAELFFEYCNRYKNTKTIKELKKGKKYNIIIEKKENLGTNKWGNWFSDYEIIENIEHIKETECYYEFKIYGHPHKIQKTKVVYIIL